MAHMRVGFAHTERRRIAQRTKVALAARRAQACASLAMSISDFELGRDGKRLLPEPRERQILRELMALRQTHTYQATADALNARLHDPERETVHGAHGAGLAQLAQRAHTRHRSLKKYS